MTATPRPAACQNQADHQDASRRQSSTIHPHNLHPGIPPRRCCSIRTPFGGSRHPSHKLAPGFGARSGVCTTRKPPLRANSRRGNARTESIQCVGARQHHDSAHGYRGDVRSKRPAQADSKGLARSSARHVSAYDNRRCQGSPRHPACLCRRAGSGAHECRWRMPSSRAAGRHRDPRATHLLFGHAQPAEERRQCEILLCGEARKRRHRRARRRTGRTLGVQHEPILAAVHRPGDAGQWDRERADVVRRLVEGPYVRQVRTPDAALAFDRVAARTPSALKERLTGGSR